MKFGENKRTVPCRSVEYIDGVLRKKEEITKLTRLGWSILTHTFYRTAVNHLNCYQAQLWKNNCITTQINSALLIRDQWRLTTFQNAIPNYDKRWIEPLVKYRLERREGIEDIYMNG